MAEFVTVVPCFLLPQIMRIKLKEQRSLFFLLLSIVGSLSSRVQKGLRLRRSAARQQIHLCINVIVARRVRIRNCRTDKEPEPPAVRLRTGTKCIYGKTQLSYRDDCGETFVFLPWISKFYLRTCILARRKLRPVTESAGRKLMMECCFVAWIDRFANDFSILKWHK